MSSFAVHLAAPTPKPATGPSITVQATGGAVKLNKKTIQVSGVRGTTGKLQSFIVTNSGTGDLTLGTDAFSITGTDASQFQVVGASLPKTIAPGKRATFSVALTPASNADVTRILTAKLNVKPADAPAATAAINLRGLATVGEGEDREPSLQRLLELFEYSINTGDATPDTTFLDIPTGATTDQITAPRFQKAENGYVTITPLAQYVPDSDTFAGAFGYYEPGTPDKRTTLFTLDGDDAQAVNPDYNGSAAWDPGNRAFSFWAEAPKFIDGSGPRIIYGEEALNTWEPTYEKRNKVNVYPLKENGTTVANAYVIAFEEYPPANDQNDYVFVIRNVTPLKSMPELGLITQNGQLESTRLAMSRFETPDNGFNSRAADTAVVRVVNTGNKDLVINSIGLTKGAGVFQLVGAPSTATLRRNATLDLTIQFVAHGGDRHVGTLALQTNDRDEPTREITLGGFWQSSPETDGTGTSQEPLLQEIFATFGIRTTATYDGEQIDGRGARVAVGDEILTASLVRADSNKPASIEQIAGFHSQGTTNGVGWYDAGSQQNNVLFFTHPDDAQTFFPRKSGSSDLARATFSPTGAFGMRLDNEFTDDDRNAQVSGDLGGHHFRFYPLRDSTGAYVADAYLMTMDFSSINFDYNDNVFILRNVRPIERTGAIVGLTGTGTKQGNVLDWGDVEGAKGYEVYRSNTATGTYSKISGDVLLTGSNFTDTGATRDRTRHYRIVAISQSDQASLPAYVPVYRPK